MTLRKDKGLSNAWARAQVYWSRKAYRQEEQEEEEEPGEDQCHPSGYNRRRSRAAVS